jgi:beta-1,4-mannooligosaccharide/beta-1,4-mannosyl-N-acetylglucosamine phosphorylase
MAFIRHPANPILTRAGIPRVPPRIDDVSSVFNPGATVFAGRVLLLLRVQTRGRETLLMAAESDDGIHFVVRPREVPILGLEKIGEVVYHAYDPRISRIEDWWYVVRALDLERTCRLALTRTRDFETLEYLGLVSDGDSRNGVLLPRQVDGRWILLERPNDLGLEGGPFSGEAITAAVSEDLRRWTRAGEVARGRPRYWDERIGSGPPPISTPEGWLHVYHGVATHFASVNIYQAGVLLLASDDPTRVLARGRRNILEPRERYETVGQVPNVVFPSGWVVRRERPRPAEELSDGSLRDTPRQTAVPRDGTFHDAAEATPDDTVYLYYGAADTVVGLATARVRDLLAACREDA